VPRESPQCGCSSVGRAQPCQGWGRRFEPGHPLCKRRRHSQVVRQRSAKPPFPGSNPGAASAPLFHLCLRSQRTFELSTISTKPMVSPAANAAAVVRLEAATIAMRVRARDKPKLCTVSSPKASATSGEAHTHSTPRLTPTYGMLVRSCGQLHIS
jgi:hypothetical protein